MLLCSLNTLTAILLLLSVIQAVKSECNPKSETKGDLASVSLISSLEDYENATDECEDDQGLIDEDTNLNSNNENGHSSSEYSSKDKNMMVIVALSVAGFVVVLIMVNIKLFFEMRKKIKANQQESRDQNVDR
ncbi:PREDICTED: uncharacterized protein LOC109581567 [Amphimedon queenslandica]|uniref:Syndecan/Neurexin domain-containing protein n=1 Tax=Amphimedon queenslandica TaxID=400682 RepID=A0A1X7V075_AMPQE|nr:PREDICTED: uncharacterized protein LOC109581567 [Amphimedon queenslandica]|eukprot:XP_019851372.1 PREDICTED: uncharacterized protein LOC109581567 [Amphimedon queenslandica]